MRLITQFELANCTQSELHALHRQALTALLRSDFGTAARRNALASLENIERALASFWP